MENIVLEKIKQKYKSVRQFAIEIDVPYTTIKSGLASGVGGMAVDTVIKMAHALDMTVDELIGAPPLNPSKAEKDRKRAELYAEAKQSNDPVVKALIDAIDKLLGIDGQ